MSQVRPCEVGKVDEMRWRAADQLLQRAHDEDRRRGARWSPATLRAEADYDAIMDTIGSWRAVRDDAKARA